MGHELGGPRWTYAVMLAGVPGLAAFVRAERRHELLGHQPLLATSLYDGRAFTGGSLTGALLFIAGTGIGLGWSVLKAGLVNIPFALICTTTAGVGAAVLMPRIGRKVLVIGALVMALGAAVMAVTVRGADGATSFWAFVPAIMLIGAGFGFVVSSTALLALVAVAGEHAGAASGQFNTTGQLANALGAAAMGTLFFEVAKRQVAGAPSEIFGPAFLAVLAVMAGLLVLVALAALVIPRDAHEHAAPGASAH